MIQPSETLVGTQLNSVWLEGVLITDPEDVPAAPPACRFQVQVPRPALADPTSTFVVEASESALDGCRFRLRKGHSVRIIGRLHQQRWRDPSGKDAEEVKIVSELVEPSSSRIVSE